MNRHLVRIFSLIVFGAGCFLHVMAQQAAHPTVSEIEAQLKADPTNPKLYVSLGLAYSANSDYPHAAAAFQEAVKLGPGSAEAHSWLGVAILQGGDFAGAEAEFRRAISLDPKYTRAYTNLGSALAKNGKLPEAVQVFEKAVALEPHNPVTRMNLGVALREKGDAKAALVQLRLVAQDQPNSANVKYVLGQTLQQSGDLGGAVEALDDSVRLDPEFRDGYYALGLALKQLAASMRKPRPPSSSPADDLYRRGQEAASRGDLKEAAQLLSEAVGMDEKHAAAHNLLGFVKGQQGDLISALVDLERAVALRPDWADAHYNYGVALWYSGSRERSLSELGEAVRLDPAGGATYAFLGNALRDSGQLDQARRNLQRALAMLPSSPATYVDLGTVYLRLGDLDMGLGQIEAGLHVPNPTGPDPDWDTAIADLRKALSAKPDNAEAHNVLGLLLGHKGADTQDVLAQFREAIRLRSNFVEAYNNMGLVLAQNNDDQGAIAAFREALRIQPNYADAHANLGSVLSATDSDEAVRELEKAIALAPGSVKAQFNLAVAYGSNPNYGAAKEIEQLRKVLAVEPKFPQAHLALGKALFTTGQVDESVGELQEAVQLDPQSTAAHYQLGLALARVGRKEQATAELKKSRELASVDDRKHNADLDIAEARIALDKGELDEAAGKLHHALTLQPDWADAEHLLAIALEKRGDTEGAVAAYQKTLELNPGDVQAREKLKALSAHSQSKDDPTAIARYDAYFREQKFQEVEPLLQVYVQEHPQSSWGWYALGYTFFAQKKIGDSIEALANSLQIDIRNAEAHKILGRDLMIIGRFDAARLEFQQGVQYDPGSAEMHFNLGKLYSIQDQWPAARNEFEAALRIDPSYLEALDGLGFAEDALNDDAGAVTSFEKAIAINEQRKGKYISAHVNLSAHYNRKGDSVKALIYARAALALDPDSDAAWFQEAKAEEARGHLNEAADALNKAIALNPRMSSYYWVLSTVYRRLGKPAESKQALESFMRLEKENNQIEQKRRDLANRSGEPKPPESQPD